VTAGSVKPGATINTNTATPGTIAISMFNATEFSGSGTVVNIQMKVIGPISSSSVLALTDFRYNNDLVCTTKTNGSVNVISGTVSGKVNYSNNAAPNYPVPNVTINAPGSPNRSAVTDANGNYSISGFGPGSYTATPSKTPMDYHTPDGIFVDDAAKVARFVVGLDTLTPEQQAAANVSGLSSISSFDAALIAQWIVGIANPINQTGKWKFTPSSRSLGVVNADQTGQGFSAILMGDVTGDWTTSPTARPARLLSEDAVRASAAEIAGQHGDVVTVPIRLENMSGTTLRSYQFDVEYDPAVLTPLDGAADIAGTKGEGMMVVSHSPEPGLLKVAVFGSLPVSGDGVYADLRFTAMGNAGSSTSLSIKRFRIDDGSTDTATVNGRVTITSAAHTSSINGRVLATDGRPLSRMNVVMTSTSGEAFTAVTSSFGYFSFDGLTVGETYTLRVESKRYRFGDTAVSVTDSIAEVELIARP
jgi:hypothetical protein